MSREYIGAGFTKDMLMTEDMPYEDTDIVMSVVDFAVVYEKEITERYEVRSDIIQNLSNENIRIFRIISS